MSRLPTPGGDSGNWGDILNDFLSQAHKSDGTLNDNAVTANTIAPDSIIGSKLATGAVDAVHIADGVLTEAKLTSAVQAKLNTAGSGAVADGTITTVKLHDDAVTDAKVAAAAAIAQSKIANLTTDLAGKAAATHTHTSTQISDSTATGRSLLVAADAAAARSAIGAGTSNLAIGTTSTTAKAGDYTPTKSDVGLGNVDNTSDTNKPVSTAMQAALDGKQPLITNGSITEALLDSGVQTKLNAGSAPAWSTITGKPTVIAAGSTQSAARATIGVIPHAIRAPAFGSPVTSRGANRDHSTTSSNLIETTRVMHTITEDCLGIHLIYFGWGANESTPTVNATIKADIEIGGVIHPVAFGGSRTATLTAGFTLRTDSLGLRLVKGDVIWIRTARTIASGSFNNNVTLRASLGEGKTTTDVADSGTVTVVGDDTSTDGLTAAGVVSSAPSVGRCLAIIGESASNGAGETVPEMGGYIARSLPDSVGVFRLNGGGGTASKYAGNGISSSPGRRRIAFAPSCKYAWVTYGGNDLVGGSSVATLQSDLLKLWNSLAAAGLTVYQSTLTPFSTSTDGFTTTTNQTAWVNDALRTAINDWIRTTPAPLSGYFDVAAITETTPDSGIWRVDQGFITDDGIHPNTLGHTYIASTLAASVATAFV